MAAVAQAGAQPPRPRQAAQQGGRRAVGGAQRAEARVRPRRQQPVLHAEPSARWPVARGAVAPVEAARPAVEDAALAPGQAPGVGGGLQDRREELLEQRSAPLGRQAESGGVRERQLGLVEQVRVVLAGQVQPVALPPHPVPYDHLAQHRHPFGAGRDPGTEADVRVVPGGEVQPALGEEGAAVDRAPGGQVHAGQLRGAVGGEGAVRGLRQQRGGRVGGLALPPGHALVLEVEDIDAAGVREACVQGRQRPGHEDVVAVEEQQVRAGRRPHPGVARPGQTGRRRRVHGRHPGVPLGVLPGDVRRGAVRAVADRDQLEVAEGLAEDRVQCLGEPPRDPMGRDDDAEAGHTALSLVVLVRLVPVPGGNSPWANGGQRLSVTVRGPAGCGTVASGVRARTAAAEGAGRRSASGTTGGRSDSPSTTRRTTRSAARPSS
ncbi:hypothetical protein STENM36S_01333 [Streptomyces tendae]